MMLRRFFPAAACAAGVFFSSAWATAQTAPLQSETRPVAVDSGVIASPAAGAGPQVVWSEVVAADGASWIRLKFDEVTLAQGVEEDTAAFLRITSFDDAAIQTMHQWHVEQWRNTSAYFNGDAVLVEVLAFPRTGVSRVRMSELTAGLPPADPETICGPTDDRTLSTDARSARLLPVGCTGWIINDCGHCFLTAGHCTSPMDTVQFNVPLSTSSGGLRHPGPEDQYAVDPASMQTNGGGTGIGDDWGYFGVHPNSTTGMTPIQAQGAAFDISTAAPPVGSPAQSIRITGYGTTGAGIPREWNQVQKTHAGPYALKSGSTVRYRTDTTGGNSGSPVLNEATGQAIGIHTHGGCDSTGGSNAGTAIDHSGLQAALAAPRGVCCAGPGGGVLTTGLPNNGSGGVFMDLTNRGAPARITGFDVAYSGTTGDSVDVEVWTRDGSYVGFDGSSTGWTLTQTVQGIKMGATTLSPLELTTPILIDGETAVYLQATGPNSGGIRYNGTSTAPPQTMWSNADLELFSDVARTGLTPFGGSSFTPRAFAGAVHYELVGSGTSLVTGQPNNGSGGVFMDLTNRGAPVRITGFDVAYSGTTGDSVDVEVWTRDGSYVGFDGSSAGWTLTQTVQGIKMGATTLSPLELTTPILIDGETAVYLQATGPNSGGIRYNGTSTAPPQTMWSNADLELFSDVARTGLTPFGGSSFTPRAFAGAVHYEFVSGTSLTTTFQGGNGHNGAMFDLTAKTPIRITGFDYNDRNGGPGSVVEVYYVSNRTTYQGKETTARSWTLLGTETVPSPAPPGSPTHVDIGGLEIDAGDTVGIYFTIQVDSISYTNGPLGAFENADLRFEDRGVGVVYPFSSIFSPRIWNGTIYYEVIEGGCYADCDESSKLDFFDFLCFQNEFAGGSKYADCDESGGLDFFDFLCFQNEFAAGCP